MERKQLDIGIRMQEALLQDLHGMLWRHALRSNEITNVQVGRHIFMARREERRGGLLHELEKRTSRRYHRPAAITVRRHPRQDLPQVCRVEPSVTCHSHSPFRFAHI